MLEKEQACQWCCQTLWLTLGIEGCELDYGFWRLWPHIGRYRWFHAQRRCKRYLQWLRSWKSREDVNFRSVVTGMNWECSIYLMCFYYGPSVWLEGKVLLNIWRFDLWSLAWAVVYFAQAAMSCMPSSVFGLLPRPALHDHTLDNGTSTLPTEC